MINVFLFTCIPFKKYVHTNRFIFGMYPTLICHFSGRFMSDHSRSSPETTLVWIACVELVT